MKGKDHVKIILPCANEGEWLRVTVDSLLEHTDYPSFEIVVSANGDTMTDFSFMEKPAYRKQVGLEQTKEVLGVGRARNAAVTPGDASFYVFLDAHCFVEQRDWLHRVVACLEEHPKCSMVQPEVLSFICEKEIQAGETVGPSQIQKHGFEYCTKWCWPYEKPWVVTEMETMRVKLTAYEGMAGAGMAIFTWAETFHRLGKFDSEVIGWYHETMDYCVRAWMLGYPMLVEPNIQVLHRAKMEKPNYPRLYTHIFQGTLRTAYKYLSPRRRDLAEALFRRHGCHAEVDLALERVRRGNWLAERVRHLKERVHDDDWLFSKFEIYEERFAG